MEKRTIRSRWVTVLILSLFLLFSQVLGFFIEPITTVVSAFTSMTDRWFDIITPTDLIVMALFLPAGGILLDRNFRKPLIVLGGFLWGVSALLMGISPTFATFNVSKAIYGFSRVSFCGIYALTGDFYKPVNRGKVLSLLLLAHPFSIVIGTTFQDVINLELHWREFLFLLGVIALLITLAARLKVDEPIRGEKEPALTDIPLKGTYRLDLENIKLLLTRPSLVLIYFLILFGTAPAVVLWKGVPVYLQDVHALSRTELFSLIIPGMLGIVLGCPVGGALGDLLFRGNKTGRLVVSSLGFIVPPISLIFTLRFTDVGGTPFLFWLLVTSFFLALTLPNLFASIMDVTLPEIRASAFAIGLLVQTLSFLITPPLLSYGQTFFSIADLILWMCSGSWVICLCLLLGLFFVLHKDIETLRRHMAYRGLVETRLSGLEEKTQD